MAAMAADPTARFSWAEVAYLSRWWQDQSNATRQMVQQLFHQGQLEFVEGGWCQADELVASVDGRLQQLQLGHDFLVRHFGPTAQPRVGWKIDPMGASDVTPLLFTGAALPVVVQARIPYQLKDSLLASQRGELWWCSGPGWSGNRANACVLAHILESYSALCTQGFDFDQYRTPSPPVTPENVAARAQVLVDFVRGWGNATATPLVMVPWGGDFRWQNGSFYFGNMSRLMAHVNANPALYQLDLRLATVSEYLRDVAALYPNRSLATLEGPFEPYDGISASDAANGYWTGLLSSRPEIKRAARRGEASLRPASLLAAVSGSSADVADQLAAANANLGILPHHDAITGTCNAGIFNGSDPIHGGGVCQDFLQHADAAANASQSLAARLLQSRVLNCSVNATLQPLAPDAVLPALPASLLLFNPSGFAGTLPLSLPLPPSATATTAVDLVLPDGSHRPLPTQLTARDSGHGSSSLWVSTLVPVEAYGIASLRVYEGTDSRPVVTFEPVASAAVQPLHSGGVWFNASGVQLLCQADICAELMYYENTTSDAYVFRPTHEAVAGPGSCRVSVAQGDVYSAVQYNCSDGGTLVLSSTGGMVAVEAGSLASLPLQVEQIVRFSAATSGLKQFLIDAGLGFAAVNAAPVNDTGGLYRPAVVAAALANATHRFAVYTHESHGAASVRPGSLELMIQRNAQLEHEGPPDNGTNPWVSAFHLDLRAGFATRTDLAHLLRDPPQILLVGDSGLQPGPCSAPPLLSVPDPCVRVQHLGPSPNPPTIILRLQNVCDERAASLDLASLLPGWQVVSASRTTLTGFAPVSVPVASVSLAPLALAAFSLVIAK